MDLVKLYIKQKNFFKKDCDLSESTIDLLSNEAKREIYSLSMTKEKPTITGYIKTQSRLIVLNLLAPSLLTLSMIIAKSPNQIPALISTLLMACGANFLLFHNYKRLLHEKFNHQIADIMVKDFKERAEWEQL